MRQYHGWDDVGPGPGIEGRTTVLRICRKCKNKMCAVRAGDAWLEKRYWIDGQWVKGAPGCTRPRIRKARDKNWTEAQRVTFQGPVAPRRF